MADQLAFGFAAPQPRRAPNKLAISRDSDAMPQGTAQYGHLSGVVRFPPPSSKGLSLRAAGAGKLIHLIGNGVYQEWQQPSKSEID